MKFITLLLLLFSSLGYSQIDKGQSIAIPSTNNDVNTSTSIPASKPIPGSSVSLDISDYKPTSDKYKIGESKGVDFGASGEEFGNPGEKYEKKLNQKRGTESSVAVKGNQYFGDFKNDGDYVNLKFRDFGLEDGDMIKISVNDVVVLSSVTLTNNFKVFNLPLKPGFNKVDFEALNQGYSGPNTAEFHVFDDKGKLVVANQWNLATGFKATVIIVKE